MQLHKKDFVIFALSALLIVSVFVVRFKQIKSITTNPTRVTLQASALGGIVVDHNSLDLFDQIPEEYIAAARNLRMLFIDRSVGGNINDGLTCWSYASVAAAPSHCKRFDHAFDDPSTNPWSDTTVNYNPNSRYNRSNWVYQYWDSPMDTGSWTGKVPAYLDMLNPQIANYDVVSYQFSYLEVNPDSTIADPEEGFFVDDPTRVKDVFDLENFESQYTDKVFIYWTTSLARNTGSQVSDDFNEQMRQYTRDNNKVLLDAADILSHDPNGNPCYDNRDGVTYRTESNADDGVENLAICPHYTTEINGGHLGSVSGGKLRVAKALWVLMAQLAGWNPGGSGGGGNPVPPSGEEPTNTAPTVNAGQSQSVTLGGSVNLNGVAGDDGLPNNSLTVTWSKVSGPGLVSFANPNSVATSVIIDSPGSYTLLLTADDGELSSTSTVTVEVVEEESTIADYFLDFESLVSPGASCVNCSNLGVDLTDGLNGSGYLFNGVSSYSIIGNTGLIKGSNSFTFNLWIKPAFNQTETVRRDVISDGNSFQVFYLNNLQDFRVNLRLPSGTKRVDTVGLTWDPDTWHMITVSYDGSSLKLYWDGLQKSNLAANGTVISDTMPAYLGTTTARSTFFSGSIDELKVFPGALSASEIQSLYISR